MHISDSLKKLEQLKSALAEDEYTTTIDVNIKRIWFRLLMGWIVFCISFGFASNYLTKLNNRNILIIQMETKNDGK